MSTRLGVFMNGGGSVVLHYITLQKSEICVRAQCRVTLHYIAQWSKVRFVYALSVLHYIVNGLK
jgi:hypothetical protein